MNTRFREVSHGISQPNQGIYDVTEETFCKNYIAIFLCDVSHEGLLANFLRGLRKIDRQCGCGNNRAALESFQTIGVSVCLVRSGNEEATLLRGDSRSISPICLGKRWYAVFCQQDIF